MVPSAKYYYVMMNARVVPDSVENRHICEGSRPSGWGGFTPTRAGPKVLRSHFKTPSNAQWLCCPVL